MGISPPDFCDRALFRDAPLLVGNHAKRTPQPASPLTEPNRVGVIGIKRVVERLRGDADLLQPSAPVPPGSAYDRAWIDLSKAFRNRPGAFEYEARVHGRPALVKQAMLSISGELMRRNSIASPRSFKNALKRISARFGNLPSSWSNRLRLPVGNIGIPPKRDAQHPRALNLIDDAVRTPRKWRETLDSPKAQLQNGQSPEFTAWSKSSGGAEGCAFLVLGCPGVDRFSSPLLLSLPRNRILDATTSTEVRSLPALSS
jgi:hypothetical protein